MEELKKIIEQMRAQWAKLPSRSRFVIALLTLATLAGAAAMSLRGQTQDYAVLFSNMQTEDAARVLEQLKAQNILYKLSGNGTAIEVPEARVHELRLSLAAAGLPRGGGVGFELFDKQSFGTTSFVEQLNYRRALQGELARTIMALEAVDHARVHVAVPERTLYKDNDDQPSASVMLQLKPGRKLDSNQVRGVVRLVASSVPGLKSDRVTVVDEAGTPLWSGEDSSSSMQGAAELERSLSRRVREMVDRVVGVGRSSVVVTAELDETRVERTEDTYDRDKPALRSESKTEERSDGASGTGGVAGARGNLPGAPMPSAAPNDPGRLRLSDTQNFEINHVFSHTVQPQMRIKRLHVAVLVDQALGKDGKGIPRTAEELARITSLARAAAGLEDDRGDKIEVASVAFVPVPPEGTAAPEKAHFPQWIEWAAMGVSAMFLILFAAAIARRRTPQRGEVIHALPAPVGKLEATLANNDSGGSLNPATSRDRVLGAARGDSVRAARVISSWLGEPQEAKR